MQFPFLRIIWSLVLGLVAGATAAQNFRSAAVQAVSGTPVLTATADFNHDGRPDIVYQDSYSGGSLHVMIGNGDGTFHEVQQVPLPTGAGARLTAADVNNDGYPDVLVGYDGFATNFLPVQYNVLLNRGDGTLGPPIASSFPVYGSPEYTPNLIAVADFTGDGNTDFVLAASAGVVLMKGDGQGHFTGSVVLSRPSIDVRDVLTADFNGDGLPDIVVNGSFGILYGQNAGGGVFSSLQTISTALMNPPTGFYVADVNNDKHPDVLFGSNGSMFIAYGNGDGTFKIPVLRGSAGQPIYFSFLAVKDVNGDGRPDLITSNPAGPIVELQDTSGKFPYQYSHAPAVGDFGLAGQVYADFDGDGIGDIVSAGTGALVFSKGRADGTFNGALATTTMGNGLDSQPADFNGDGEMDVAVMEGGGSYYGSMYLYQGDSAGNYTYSGYAYGFGKYSNQFSVADLNGDGLPDVFTSGYMLPGKGSGGFGTEQVVAAIPVGSRPFGFTAIADFNEDGIPDGATVTVSSSNLQSGTIAVGLSGSGGARNMVQVQLPVVPGPLVAADFNKDGHADLAVAGPNTIVVYSGDGKGNFAERGRLAIGYTATSYGGIQYGWNDMEAADVDGDGNIDLLLPIADHNVVQIFYGRDDGSFEQAISLTTAQDVRYVTVHDMDGDGVADLVFGGHAMVRILRGLGHRSFAATPSLYAANAYPQKVRIADMNHDGQPDMIVSNGGMSSILEPGYSFTVLLNGAPPLSPDVLSAALVCTPEPSQLQQPWSCTATFTPLANKLIPSGDITFTLDGTPLGTATLSAGRATFAFPATAAAGSHPITANFPGDANFRATPAETTHIIVRAAATLLLSGPARVAYGQTVNLQLAASGSAGTPTGNVHLREGSTMLQMVALSGGAAAFSVSSLASGSHTLVASYDGDSTFAAGASNTVIVLVDPQPTQVVLTATPAATAYGGTVTLEAALTTASGPATGTVVFMDGATPLGNVTTNSAGVARLQTTTLAIGVHSITAQFNATAALGASTSAAVLLEITGIATTTTLTVTPSPSYVQQSVKLTATVSSLVAQAISGTVRFLDGTITLADVPVAANGTASYSTSSLPIGDHDLSALYLGASGLITSQSPTVKHTVLESGFALSAPVSITVQTQHHLTFAMTVTPRGAFAGNISLDCGVLPEHATCKITPTSVRLTSFGPPQTVSVFLDTSDVPYYAMARPWPGANPHSVVWLGLLFPSLLAGIRTARRHGKNLLTAMLVLLFACGAIAGCSGKYPASVAPGVYTLRFTGTSSNPNLVEIASVKLVVTE